MIRCQRHSSFHNRLTSATFLFDQKDTTIYLRNFSDQAVVISSISSNNPRFVIQPTSLPCTIRPKDSAAIIISFHSDSVKTENAALAITTSLPDTIFNLLVEARSVRFRYEVGDAYIYERTDTNGVIYHDTVRVSAVKPTAFNGDSITFLDTYKGDLNTINDFEGLRMYCNSNGVVTLWARSYRIQLPFSAALPYYDSLGWDYGPSNDGFDGFQVTSARWMSTSMVKFAESNLKSYQMKVSVKSIDKQYRLGTSTNDQVRKYSFAPRLGFFLKDSVDGIRSEHAFPKHASYRRTLIDFIRAH